jgi:hypothetical protein
LDDSNVTAEVRSIIDIGIALVAPAAETGKQTDLDDEQGSVVSGIVGIEEVVATAAEIVYQVDEKVDEKAGEERTEGAFAVWDIQKGDKFIEIAEVDKVDHMGGNGEEYGGNEVAANDPTFPVSLPSIAEFDESIEGIRMAEYAELLLSFYNQ